MKIHLLFFAALSEAVNARELELEVSGSTVGDALAELNSRFPNAASMLNRAQIAVNETYAKRDAPIRDGDTLALIPPVSGGAR